VIVPSEDIVYKSQALFWQNKKAIAKKKVIFSQRFLLTEDFFNLGILFYIPRVHML